MATELGHDQHALHGSVRPRRQQRLVGLRYLAPHHVRRRRRNARADHAHLGIPGADEPARDHGAQHEPSARHGIDVVGGKTGFISKAGYCLATLLRMPQGPQVAVVVLGAANSTARFWEARHLFNWIVGRSQGLVGGEPLAIAAEPATSRVAPSTSAQPALVSMRARQCPLHWRSSVVSAGPGHSRTCSPIERADGGVRDGAVFQDRRARGRRRLAAGSPRRARPRRDRRHSPISNASPWTAGSARSRRVWLGRASHDVAVAHSSHCRIADGSCSSTTRRSTTATGSTAAAAGTSTTMPTASRCSPWPRSTSRQATSAIPRPDVIHAHDWQAGLALSWLRRDARRWPDARRPGLVLTIHNLAYQGLFPREIVPRSRTAVGVVHDGARRVLGAVQFSEERIAAADYVTTVSPDLRARDADAAQFGAGLEGVLASPRATGISASSTASTRQSGIPRRDPFLPATFDAQDLSGKAVCKRALLERFACPRR